MLDPQSPENCKENKRDGAETFITLLTKYNYFCNCCHNYQKKYLWLPFEISLSSRIGDAQSKKMNNFSTTVVNDNGMTPLMSAAERCQETVFNYLLSKTEDRERRIEALELIG
jgi:hypothetical protein